MKTKQRFRSAIIVITKKALHLALRILNKKSGCTETEVLLTGVVAVSRVNDAKHVVGSGLFFTIPVLLSESGSATPLSQFRKHLPLRNTPSLSFLYMWHKNLRAHLLSFQNLFIHFGASS